MNFQNQEKFIWDQLFKQCLIRNQFLLRKTRPTFKKLLLWFISLIRTLQTGWLLNRNNKITAITSTNRVGGRNISLVWQKGDHFIRRTGKKSILKMMTRINKSSCLRFCAIDPELLNTNFKSAYSSILCRSGNNKQI